MYQRQLEQFLIHYQPQLREALLQAGQLTQYLTEQEEAMLRTRQQTITQLTETYPQMSQLQRELEADQLVKELYLTPR